MPTVHGSSAPVRDVRLPVTVECICGAVQLEADVPPQSVLCCHCHSCQLVSGTDYQRSAQFSPSQVTVAAGEGSLQSVDVPGCGIRRCYCSSCKAPIMHTVLGQDGNTAMRMCFPVGAITSKAGPRDPAWLPEAHVCYSERARDVMDDVPKWPGTDFEAGQWQVHDGPAAAAVPPDADALPPLPQPPTSATCHCGQTRVEADAAPSAVYYCHCSSCQQLTGADFAHNAAFQGKQLRVVAGEAQLSAYRKRESPRVTFRCGRCLVRVFRQQEAADGSIQRQVLGVGAVEKPKGNADPAWQPRFHMWYSERAVDVPDNLPKWSGMPEKSERLDAQG